MISLRKKNDLAYYGILCILDFYHFFIIKKLINFPSRSTELFNNKTYLSPLSTTLLQGLCLFNGPFELVAFGKKTCVFLQQNTGASLEGGIRHGAGHPTVSKSLWSFLCHVQRGSRDGPDWSRKGIKKRQTRRHKTQKIWNLWVCQTEITEGDASVPELSISWIQLN